MSNVSRNPCIIAGCSSPFFIPLAFVLPVFPQLLCYRVGTGTQGPSSIEKCFLVYAPPFLLLLNPLTVNCLAIGGFPNHFGPHTLVGVFCNSGNEISPQSPILIFLFSLRRPTPSDQWTPVFSTLPFFGYAKHAFCEIFSGVTSAKIRRSRRLSHTCSPISIPVSTPFPDRTTIYPPSKQKRLTVRYQYVLETLPLIAPIVHLP